jgi:hypothetical protein
VTPQEIERSDAYYGQLCGCLTEAEREKLAMENLHEA